MAKTKNRISGRDVGRKDEKIRRFAESHSPKDVPKTGRESPYPRVRKSDTNHNSWNNLIPSGAQQP